MTGGWQDRAMEHNDELITIGKAAELLGIPRLRVREAIYAGVIEGRRNNRGDWLVRWDPSKDAFLRDGGGHGIEPNQCIDVLFDEVDELGRTTVERDETIARLTKLAADQGKLIERYAKLAEEQFQQEGANNSEVKQLSDTVENTLNTLESVVDRLEGSKRDNDVLGEMLGRSLDAGSRFENALNENDTIVARQRSQIDHLIDLANKSMRRLGESGANRNGKLARVFRRLVYGEK